MENKYYYMPMPVNANGDGPCSKEEAVRILHEVWDETCHAICVCSDEEEAVFIAMVLNHYDAK